MKKVLGVVLIVFGGVFLLRELGIIAVGVVSVLWPVFLIALGVYLLVKEKSPVDRRIKDAVKNEMPK